MADNKKAKHAFEDCGPYDRKYFQPGAQIRTNALPLNALSGSSGFRLGEQEKRLRQSWTDHAFASTTDGKKRIGIEGIFCDDKIEGV
jgi:hypothetical protein